MSSDVIDEDVDHLGRLFQCCPVLEKLTIDINVLGDSVGGKNYKITLPRLRTLIIC